MGYYSGKVCSYSERSKDCNGCNQGLEPGHEGCTKNYEGSSKGMEQDMAIELFTNNDLFEEQNVFGARIAMDDDSTTIAGLQKATAHNIVKWSDRIHSSKNFKKSLYAIHLPPKLIEYFSTNFNASIQQNKNNPKGLEDALNSIVPHAFGDHQFCKLHDKENYSYANLPKNKPLESEQLRM